jgi:glyoxylase-like metal-dependent hydrolase (beta-lactamase superfamily II)
MIKKKLFMGVVGLFILIIAGIALYIFFSDNYRVVKLPKKIVPVALDMSTAYLVPIDDGYLLVDTGYENDYTRFLESLQKKGIRTNMIRYVFLTHHHDDHAGFLNQLTRENQSVRIILHEKAVPLLLTGANNINNGGGIVNPVIFGLFRLKQVLSPEWTLTFPAFTVRPQDYILSANNMILPDELAMDFSVFETPGHTTDSISLLYKKDYLFCGDMASHFLNWAGASHLTLFNEDVANVYASWRKVLAAGAKIVVPSHGKAFDAKSLEDNLDHYRQKDLVKFF